MVDMTRATAAVITTIQRACMHVHLCLCQRKRQTQKKNLNKNIKSAETNIPAIHTLKQIKEMLLYFLGEIPFPKKGPKRTRTHTTKLVKINKRKI